MACDGQRVRRDTDPLTGVQIRIGVMGSASEPVEPGSRGSR